MAYVNVDIDLDDLNLDDILENLEDRISRKRSESKEIKEWIKDQSDGTQNVATASLIDQMKIDFLMNNIQKITINDLENLIK